MRAKNKTTTAAATTTTATPIDWHLDRCRSYLGLVRRTAQVRLITDVIRKTEQPRRVTGEDICTAATTLWRWIQQEAHPEERRALQKGNPLHRQSNIARLNPVWDAKDQLIRVTGRVESMFRDQKIEPPILLPSNHPVVGLLIQHTHKKLRHSGVRTTLTELRNRFWIVRGRQQTKKLVKQCIPCRKLQARPFDQPKAELTGVDFAGPLIIKPDNQ